MTTNAALVPTESVPDAAWSLLLRGADDPEHPVHVLTMATVGIDGKPTARLMAIRGADRARARLWFHTDAASPKCSELRARPETALVGWDRSTGAEARLSGVSSVHERGPLADRHWEHAVRIAGHVAEHPQDATGFSADPRLSSLAAADGLAAALTARARAAFAVIEVAVYQIDWFQAIGPSRRRAVLRARDGWTAHEVPA